MKSFGEKIREARKAEGLTQKGLASKIGAAHNSVSDWENDKNKPDPDTIELLCGVLKISPNYLLDADTKEFSPAEKAIIEKYRALDEHGKKIVDYILDEEYERSTIIEEPVSYDDSNVIHYVGRIAAAGKGVYIDGIPGEIIKVKNKPLDASFAIGVTGDSMEPDYYDGDVVYVHKQSEIEFGEIGLWQIGNEFFIKEYHPEGLKSSNPNYPIMPASPDIRLIGKVIGTVRQ